MRNILLVIMLLCVLLAGFITLRKKDIKEYAFNNDPSRDTIEGELYKSLAEDLNRLKIPGIQVSIITSGKQINISVGTADLERQTMLNNYHILRLGSVSKIYTSAITLKLAERNLIKLDDTIDKWFADIPYADKITVRNLLNHTSGVYSYTDHILVQLNSAVSSQKAWTPEELYQYVLKGKPYFYPGEKHYYSNSNYLLLGMIAEKASGKRFTELLNDIVINPLNLKNTFFLPHEVVLEYLISGYDRDLIPLGIHEIKPDNKVWASFGYSAGAIASNSADLAEFLKGLFTYRIINRNSLSSMMIFENCTDEDIPEQTGYGLGLRRLIIEKDTLIGHTGTIPGFGAAAFFCPEKDYYIILTGNVSYLKQTELLKTIVRILNR